MLGFAWSLLGAASQCEYSSKLTKPYISHRGQTLDYCVRLCSIMFNNVQSRKDTGLPEFIVDSCGERLTTSACAGPVVAKTAMKVSTKSTTVYSVKGINVNTRALKHIPLQI